MRIRGDLLVTSTRHVSIQVHDLGGEGEPLLICHATGFCGRSYEPLAAELTDFFHVWAIDFRGHGMSASPEDGDYSWDRMAEDVHAAKQAISAAGVHVLGHSMGGAAALLAEARWPGTIRAAYVFEPAILSSPGRTGPVELMTEQALRRTSVFRSRDDARDRLRRRPTFSTWTDLSLDAFVEHGFMDLPDGTVTLRCSPEAEASCYASSTSSIEDIASVRAPLTVGAGLAHDMFGAALNARALTDVIPHARLAEHHGLSHFGPFEDPALIARAARHALTNGMTS